MNETIGYRFYFLWKGKKIKKIYFICCFLPKSTMNFVKMSLYFAKIDKKFSF